MDLAEDGRVEGPFGETEDGDERLRVGGPFSREYRLSEKLVRDQVDPELYK